MIKKILQEALNNKKLVDIIIFDLKEEDDSIIGYIVKIDDTCFTLHEVDKLGNLYGFTTYEIDNIKELSTNNWYLRNLEIIMLNNSKMTQDLRVTILKNANKLMKEFSYLKENKIITMLFFSDDNFELGIILDYDDNFLLLKDIGQDGIELGITCYRLATIIGLRYNGLGEQKTQLLYEHYKAIEKE